MSELVFPAAALAVTFFVLMPACSVGARLALAHLRRSRGHADYGGDLAYALLVAPAALPLAWLASAALHQTDAHHALRACVNGHVEAGECVDALILLGALAVVVALAFVREARRARVPSLGATVSPTSPATRRVAALVARESMLADLRVQVREAAPAPAFVVGWLRPRVILDAGFVAQSDDDMLLAALLHEAAHARAHDPLRVLVARVCLALDPVGAWLAPELERWRQAREVRCDGVAVSMGGDPLALAEGIVRAARFRCAPTAVGITALCRHEARLLELRVALLLHGPTLPARSLALLGLAACLALLVSLPHAHVGGIDVLEQFHHLVERLAGDLAA